jgi:hypothetical protein
VSEVFAAREYGNPIPHRRIPVGSTPYPCAVAACVSAGQGWHNVRDRIGCKPAYGTRSSTAVSRWGWPAPFPMRTALQLGCATETKPNRACPKLGKLVAGVIGTARAKRNLKGELTGVGILRS